MNELPKALTEHQQAVLSAIPSGRAALAWIESATSLLAAQAAQIVLDGQLIAELEARLNGH